MSSRFEFGTKKVEFGKASSKISTGTHLHFGGKSKGLKADTSFANGDILILTDSATQSASLQCESYHGLEVEDAVARRGGARALA